MRLKFIICLLSYMATSRTQTPDTIAYRKAFITHRYDPPGAEKLKPLLLSRPDAARYLHKYQLERWTATGLGLGGVALLGYGGQEKFRPLYDGKLNPYLVTAGVLFTGTVYFVLHSLTQRHRAVKAYNRSVAHQRRAAL